MTKRTSVLQKTSLVLAGLSFVFGITSGVLLYIRSDNMGFDNPISASLMASTFFFICVGVVLGVIGSADIPSFKFDNSEGE